MEFSNPSNLRDLLTLSLLTAKNVVVNVESPFEDYELRLLDLIALVAPGSKIFLSNNNQTLHFRPGSLTTEAEAEFEFDCRNTRSITYFLEPLILLGLFSKGGLRFNLTGITNDSVDLTVDAVRDSLLPLLHTCYKEVFAAELKIHQRGFRPSGNGRVSFSISPVRTTLPPLQVKPQQVYVKRIRGTVITSKTSAQFLNRIINKTREVFNDYIPDVWVYSVLVKNSPDVFYGISLHSNNHLVAEASFDRIIEADAVKSPEDIATEACLSLLDEIRYSSGVVPTSYVSLVLTMMALGNGRSAISVGQLTDHCVETLRLVNSFVGVKFHFDDLPGDEPETPLVLAKCSGVALINRATEKV
jgi:RNA 3'-terminal phosphate cyclase-like protein